MTDVLLFHHAQGLTKGIEAFAAELRAAGHTVTVPDLYGGLTFDSIDEGVAHAESIGFDQVTALGEATARDLPANIVYAGFSLGALPAQKLAQTRPGALGALIYHGGVPSAMFGGPWPGDVALQLHLQAEDEWSELDVAEALTAEASDAALFVYPGSAHLVTDSSLPEFDPVIAGQIMERSLAFLERWATDRQPGQ